MNSTSDNAWDITVEIFNLCAGSCTGCMLTPVERRNAAVSLSEDAFAHAVQSIAAYGRQIGATFRPVLAFGDVPLIPTERLKQMFDACRDAGMPFGLTLTLANEDETLQYGAALALASSYRDTVFDLTLDPIRFKHNPSYAKRVRWGLAMNKHNHVQVLLSEAVLKKTSPQELSAIVLESSPQGHASIAFTPTQANVLRTQYRYRAEAAADYAKAFYATHPAHADHFRQEIDRFQASGAFEDFVRHSFHVGKDLNIYAVAYTPFGDIILDERNGGKALGNLQTTPLDDILAGASAASLSCRNGVYLDQGDFGCSACDRFDSCCYHGVGLARNLYVGVEEKTGLCYGPKAFES